MEGKNNIVVIGGGAAGFFAAISAAEQNPLAKVHILEAGNRVLRKVKISGGGRCNLTHHCFDPKLLSTHYPRGERELRGAFHRWQPQDTIDWFEREGVKTKTEPDGRMFPVTDRSQTVIDCLQNRARKLGIKVKLGCRLESIKRVSHDWLLSLSGDQTITADKICLALGSLKESNILAELRELGHTIDPLLPSLFAFNLEDHPMKDLSGLSVQMAQVQSLPLGKPQSGPLLITHRGFSGPAILKASAWDAKELAKLNYKFEVSVNWIPSFSTAALQDMFSKFRTECPTQRVMQNPFVEIPKRLWHRFVSLSQIEENTTWAHLNREQRLNLQNHLTDFRLPVNGKTTNKDEFVTCGGICLKEVDFRTMESKKQTGLFFAGECLNLDGITGGFNFQAAWTTGRIAGETMGKSFQKTTSA